MIVVGVAGFGRPGTIKVLVRRPLDLVAFTTRRKPFGHGVADWGVGDVDLPFHATLAKRVRVAGQFDDLDGFAGDANDLGEGREGSLITIMTTEEVAHLGSDLADDFGSEDRCCGVHTRKSNGVFIKVKSQGYNFPAT